MFAQAVMRPDGLPIWVGPVEPGSVHDLTCAQDHALGIHGPFKQPTDGRRLGVDNRTYNKLLRAMRALGKRGFALLVGR